MNAEDLLRNKALANLRERRLRLKSSAIFGAKEQLRKQAMKASGHTSDLDAETSGLDTDAEAAAERKSLAAARSRQTVDLTKQQLQADEEDGIDDLDDFDLLEATIDPNDVKSMEKVEKLKSDLYFEEGSLRIKLARKLAFREDNPMKIDE